MPAAQNHAELLTVTKLEFAKLQTLLAGVDPGRVDRPDADGWTIREVIAHRAHWVVLFLQWRAAALAGHDVQTPAPGYKWTQLTAYNALVREQAAERDWAQVNADLSAAHARLLACLEAADDAELYTKHLYPWMNDWTLGRWAEAAGASHYRSAAKTIRKMLREPG